MLQAVVEIDVDVLQLSVSGSLATAIWTAGLLEVHRVITTIKPHKPFAGDHRSKGGYSFG
jgi:hypothetical protein